MNPLFKRPKGVRFVDMAIWIDNNIYKEDCDMEQAFTYMYLLAYMLASKAKYFKNLSDYDDFAYYLAYSTFVRFTDKNKVKMKSVLNYMKSIIYWRKISYDNENFCEIINPEYNKSWNSDKYRNDRITAIENSVRNDVLHESIKDVFADIPIIIKRNIPEVYPLNTTVGKNLYTSVLLSMLSSYTLPKQYENKFNEKIEDTTSTAFNEISFYRKHLVNDIILWHLPESMKSVVQLIINKVNAELINTIRDLSNDIKISDHDFDLLSKSAFEGYDDYERY